MIHFICSENVITNNMIKISHAYIYKIRVLSNTNADILIGIR
jgi:hypothetical protein